MPFLKHLALAVGLSLFVLGCRDSHAREETTQRTKTKITIVYGAEKKTWIEREIAELAKTDPEIVVDAKAMGSGEAVTALKNGSLKAHAFVPASSAYLEMLDGSKEGETLVLSPLVIATWRPTAESLGWPDKALSWKDFLASPTFKLAHAHPETSNSGFLSVLAEAYAGAGKTRELTVADLEAPGTRAFIGDVEGRVVYYGRSSAFLLDKMIARGPSFLNAAIVYENLVVESGAPIVCVYPKEGTFWADHPYRVLDGTPAAERRAAERFLHHLKSRPAQERALALGFRPGDPKMAVGAPIDRAHGADPKQPQTILPLPPPDVLEKIASTWQLTKRGADVVIVFDKSASMKGWPLTEAKAGAEAFVDALGDRDEISFAPFDDVVYPARGPFRVGDPGIRARMNAEIELTKAGGRTSLYDAIAAAYDQALVRAAKAPGSIHAVVVMTDGKDEGSRTTLYLLKKRLVRDAPVKLFTIAYGEGAEGGVLRDIAEAAGGWSGKGSTETIRDVYVEAAAFF